MYILKMIRVILIKNNEEKIIDEVTQLSLENETMINLITIEDSEKDFIESFIENKNISEYSSNYFFRKKYETEF